MPFLMRSLGLRTTTVRDHITVATKSIIQTIVARKLQKSIKNCHFGARSHCHFQVNENLKILLNEQSLQRSLTHYD